MAFLAPTGAVERDSERERPKSWLSPSAIIKRGSVERERPCERKLRNALSRRREEVKWAKRDCQNLLTGTGSRVVY